MHANLMGYVWFQEKQKKKEREKSFDVYKTWQ